VREENFFEKKIFLSRSPFKKLLFLYERLIDFGYRQVYTAFESINSLAADIISVCVVSDRLIFFSPAPLAPLKEGTAASL